MHVQGVLRASRAHACGEVRVQCGYERGAASCVVVDYGPNGAGHEPPDAVPSPALVALPGEQQSNEAEVVGRRAFSVPAEHVQHVEAAPCLGVRAGYGCGVGRRSG
ncbi:hypothetical protein, partial [Streptomyces sp. KLMMK]|uniref:hypothetical protein n=1 Tax=Streptomyces sp. KLMMK TaxID=3109353 RepID=UPI003FA73E5D